MQKYKVFLPLPPSINHAYIHTKKGFTFLSAAAKTWKEEAAWLIHQAKIPIFPNSVKVVVEVVAYWPDARIRDMNNLAKLTCDAIQESSIVQNDKFILWREMDFVKRPASPGLDVTLYEKEL